MLGGLGVSLVWSGCRRSRRRRRRRRRRLWVATGYVSRTAIAVPFARMQSN